MVLQKHLLKIKGACYSHEGYEICTYRSPSSLKETFLYSFVTDFAKLTGNQYRSTGARDGGSKLMLVETRQKNSEKSFVFYFESFTGVVKWNGAHLQSIKQIFKRGENRRC